MCSPASTSAIAPQSTRCWRSTSRARSCTSRPRATSTVRFTVRPISCRRTSSAPSRCSKPRANTGARSHRREGGVPLPARIDGRSVRLAVAGRSAVLRNHAVRAEQPVLGDEGGLRPPRTRVSPHVRAAGAHDELLEQLRPVSVPREADSADDRERARRQAAARLRRRPERAGLAVRRRSLQRDSRGARARRAGETYNVGGWNEKKNLDVVHTLCDLLDEARPKAGGSYRDQITYVTIARPRSPLCDRCAQARARARWKPAETFETGLAKTVRWYLDHQEWVDEVVSGDYRKWVETNYAQRA